MDWSLQIFLVFLSLSYTGGYSSWWVVSQLLCWKAAPSSCACQLWRQVLTQKKTEKENLIRERPPEARDLPLLPLMQLHACALTAFPALCQAAFLLSWSTSCHWATEAMLKGNRNQGGNGSVTWYGVWAVKTKCCILFNNALCTWIFHRG